MRSLARPTIVAACSNGKQRRQFLARSSSLQFGKGARACECKGICEWRLVLDSATDTLEVKASTHGQRYKMPRERENEE
jgi:hypothetical protein